MSTHEDAFTEAFRLSISEDQIILTKKKTGILQMLFSIMIVSFLLIMIAAGGTLLGNFFILLIASLAGYMGYQAFIFNKYYKTVIDMNEEKVEKLSRFFFIKPVTYSFKKIENISLDVVSTGGHTSAYEEGNTTYEKTVVLESEGKEIPVLNYSSRVEESEKSLVAFISALRARGSIPMTGD